MVYLDNHATTACDPEVVAAMMPFFIHTYGNASSSHWFGQLAEEAVDKATHQVASLLGCRSQEIIFTSGATESNNIAILGSARSYRLKGGARRQIITTRLEHKAVISPFEQLSMEGWEVLYVPTDHLGRVNPGNVKKLISESTFLLSVQFANSEIGTIQPIQQLAALAHQNGVLFHCDAAQALGKLPIHVDSLDVDLLSISGHKIYAPKGIGALWIRHGLQGSLQPLLYGGGQAKGIRPGTMPVPLIVGLGAACDIIHSNFPQENKRLQAMRDHFELLLTKGIADIHINGDLENRLCNNSSITFPGVDAEALLANLPDIVASTNSACESGSIEPSRVLMAIGLSPEQAFQTLRFGFGRFNTMEEISSAADDVIEVYQQLLAVC